MHTNKFISTICTLFCLFALAPASVAWAQAIKVSNIEELYGTVNNAANAGAALVLSAGTYALSHVDSNGIPRPNGGRIELQRDMSLKGVEGDRGAVVIDAFNLPAGSFPQTVNGVAAGPNAAVRMGLGTNALEWLTVRDARFAQANIDSGLQTPPGISHVRIAHVALTGSARGLNVQNFGPRAAGHTLEADIVDCHFFDNDLNFSQGVRIGNFQGADGSTLNVRMSGNASWGQLQGRLIVNNGTVGSIVNVISSGNRFYGNGAGTIIAGGLSSNNTRSDGNTINFEARGDQFVANTADTRFDQGGLVILGFENASASAGGGSGNTVNAMLSGTRMLGNETADLTAIGARSPVGSTALGTNNRVTIEIRDGNGHGNGNWEPVEFFADSVPAAPNYGNSVSVIR
jgi:hypothetical protein